MMIFDGEGDDEEESEEDIVEQREVRWRDEG